MGSNRLPSISFPWNLNKVCNKHLRHRFGLVNSNTYLRLKYVLCGGNFNLKYFILPSESDPNIGSTATLNDSSSLLFSSY